MSLNQEQQKLIENNYGLVKAFVTRSLVTYQIPSVLRDDFISETLWRFCISALKFEEERGFQFSTYAHGGFKFSLQKTLLEKEKEENAKLTDYVDTKNEFQYDFLKEFVENANLKEKEKHIIIDRYCDNLTLSAIGEKYGFTKQNAQNIILKIIGKLRRKVIREDLKIEDFYMLVE